MNRIYSIVKLARPGQYLKNLFIFLPIFFGGRLYSLSAWGPALTAFAGYSLLASAIYIFNDIKDIEEDRRHPVKQFRPLARGDVSIKTAYVLILIFLAGALAIGWWLPKIFLAILIAYTILNVAYSFGLKHLAIIDITCVALGFVLRVYAGSVVTGIPLSPWLVLMTFLLAMFLALGKRWDDMMIMKLEESNGLTRKSLSGYNQPLVAQGMMLMANLNTICYIMYTMSEEVIAKHGGRQLYFTVLWVILGMFRYMQIAFVEKRSGSPTKIILTDRFIQAVIILWALHFAYLIYV